MAPPPTLISLPPEAAASTRPLRQVLAEFGDGAGVVVERGSGQPVFPFPAGCGEPSDYGLVIVVKGLRELPGASEMAAALRACNPPPELRVWIGPGGDARDPAEALVAFLREVGEGGGGVGRFSDRTDLEAQIGALLRGLGGAAAGVESSDRTRSEPSEPAAAGSSEKGGTGSSDPVGDGAVTRYEKLWTDGSPYRGEKPFGYPHSPVFFGRRAAVETILAALSRNREAGRAFVLVTGVSGIGKTSLVQAGVVPAFEAAAREAGVGVIRRAHLELVPGEEGLFLELARALCADCALPELTHDGSPVGSIAEMLRENPKGAGILVKGALSLAAQEVQFKETRLRLPPTRLVLTVDPLEALYAEPGVSPDERETFFAALQSLAKSGLVFVVATLRGDLGERCLQDHGFASLNEGLEQFILLPPNRTEIAQMTRGPALAAGLDFQEDPDSGLRLDGVILESVNPYPEALALLEMYLDRLYHHSVTAAASAPGGLLSFQAYGRAGSFEDFLVARAEAAHTALSDPAQEAFPALLKILVSMTLGETDRAARRFAPMADVSRTAESREVVEVFVRYRLLIAGSNLEGVPGVILVHPALLNRWPRAVNLLETEADFLVARARIGVDRARWTEAGRSGDYLIQGSRPVDDARSLLALRGGELTGEELDYINASVAARERRERASRRSRRAAPAAAAAAVILAGLGGVVAWREIGRARDSASGALEAGRSAAEVAAAAEEAKRATGDFASRLVEEIYRRSAARGDLAELASLAEDGLEFIDGQPPPASAAERHALAVNLNAFGHVLAEAGEPGRALEVFSRAESLLKEALGEEPDLDRWHYDLTAIRRNLGRHLIAAGELEAGIATLRGALDTLGSLCESNPEEVGWIEEFASGYFFLGETGLSSIPAGASGADSLVRRALQDCMRGIQTTVSVQDALSRFDRAAQQVEERGRTDLALEVLDQKLAAVKAAAAAEPADPDLRLELARTHGARAGLLDRAGNPTGALRAAAEQLDVLERLIAASGAEAAVPGVLGERAECRVQSGFRSLQLGRRTAAQEHFLAAATAAEELRGAQPWEMRWHELEASARLGLGVSRGGSAALEDYRRAVELWAPIVAAHPGREDWAERLAESRVALGGALFDAGDFAASVGHLRLGLGFGAPAEGAPPDAARSVTYDLLGQAEAQLGNWEAARAALQSALALAPDPPEGAGGDAARRELAGLLGRLVGALDQLDRLPDALPHLARLADILEAQTGGENADPAAENVLAEVYRKTAEAFIVAGQGGRAQEFFKKLLALLDRRMRSASEEGPAPVDVAAVHRQVAEIYLKRGNREGAVEFFVRAAELLRPAWEAGELSPDEALDLARLQNRLAELAWESGDFELAEAGFGTSIKVLEGLAGGGSNGGGQALLAEALTRLGETLLLRGDDGAAKGFLERGLALNEGLQQKEPGEPAHILRRARLVNALGRAASLGKRDAEALEQFALAADFARQAGAGPAHPEWGPLLASIHRNLGEHHAERGRYDLAVAAFQDELEGREQLAAAAAAGPEAALRRAECFFKLGEAWAGDGNPAKAATAFGSCLDAADRIQVETPGNLENRQLLALANQALADLRGGDEALGYYRAAAAHGDALAQAFPDASHWGVFLANIHNRIGGLHLERRDRPAATAALGRALAILYGLQRSHPVMASWHRDLAALEQRVGEIHLQGGKLDPALGHFRSWLKIVKDASPREASNPAWRLQAVDAYRLIAEVNVRQNSLSGALDYFKSALAELEDVLPELPPEGRAGARWKRAEINNDIGVTLLSLQRTPEARGHLEAGAEILVELADAGDAEAQLNLVGTYLNLAASYQGTETGAARREIKKIIGRAQKRVDALNALPDLLPRQRAMLQGLAGSLRQLEGSAGG